MPEHRVRKVCDIAAVLKAARENCGLSQAELGQRLVISRDYIIDLESGHGSLYINRLLKIMHELGIVMSLTYQDDHAQS